MSATSISTSSGHVVVTVETNWETNETNDPFLGKGGHTFRRHWHQRGEGEHQGELRDDGEIQLGPWRDHCVAAEGNCAAAERDARELSLDGGGQVAAGEEQGPAVPAAAQEPQPRPPQSEEAVDGAVKVPFS